MVNETNATLDLAQGDVILGLALVFCILFLMIGFKQKMWWLVAGPIWILFGISIFLDYGDAFMFMTVGVGMVLFITGAYECL